MSNSQSLEDLPSAQEPVVELDWFSEGDVVRVCPRDQRRFEIQKDRAIKLLQVATDSESQLRFLIEQVGGWVRDNAAKLKTAFLTVRDARLLFIAVSKVPACDDELEDSLSELDLRIANDPDLDRMRMNAIILPPASREALSSFFDKRFFLVYRVPGS